MKHRNRSRDAAWQTPGSPSPPNRPWSTQAAQLGGRTLCRMQWCREDQGQFMGRSARPCFAGVKVNVAHAPGESLSSRIRLFLEPAFPDAIFPLVVTVHGHAALARLWHRLP